MRRKLTLALISGGLLLGSAAPASAGPPAEGLVETICGEVTTMLGIVHDCDYFEES